MRIPSGKTDQLIFFVARSSTDGSRLTGLSSFTVYRSRNGAAATAYTTPTVAELSSSNMPGLYALTVDEDTTIAAGSDSEEYAVHITATGMLPVTRTIELYRRDTTSGATSTAQTGDAYARLGAPAGASVSADVAAVAAKTGNLPSDPADASDIASAFGTVNSTLSTIAGYIDTEVAAILAAVDTEVAAIKAKTDSLTFTVAGVLDASVTHWKGSVAPAMTGDAFARLGAPAGASVSADVAAVKVDTAAVKTKTDSLTFTVPGQVDANIQSVNDVTVTGNGQSGSEWGP